MTSYRPPQSQAETLPRPHATPQIRQSVNSHNEWDPLEEAIVGVVDGALVPSWHLMLRTTMPPEHWSFFQENGGRPFPPELVRTAARELEDLVRLLESEGVTVRRPDVVDHGCRFATPDWEQPGGLYAAMPRDVLLVVGDELIEAPMAWRCRYFEVHPYRALLKDYFCRGARWTAAPKPQLGEALYDGEYQDPHEGGPMRYAITEFEPTFDAADFIRCGRDIFAQLSHVTNRFGIAWLRRHLGEGYRVHVLDVVDSHPMHIDASFMPLAPGKLLINPERIRQLPEMFKTWEIIVAPPPSVRTDPLYMSSAWISMNVLMLDERRVIVEKHEEALIGVLAGCGFVPIPCGLRAFNAFGGSVHCATLDVRRSGALQSYF